jgi:glycine/D-amino acid oxidase-like deaminating enzyme
MLAKAVAAAAAEAPVVVVGGGLLGAATAYHLSLAGIAVVVLEREQIGAGATARSAGLMLQVSGSAEKTAMVRQTLADAEALEKMFDDGACGLRRSGSLRVAVAPARVRELEAEAAIAAAAGVRYDYVSPSAAKAKAPWLDAPRGSSILHVPSDGVVDPVGLASAYLRAAAEAETPAAVLVGREATGLALGAAGEVVGVTLAGDEPPVLPARAVVDCAGIACGDLAEVPMPFAPTRSHYWLCAGPRAPVVRRGGGTRRDPLRRSALFPADHPAVVLPDARAYTGRAQHML